MLGKKKNSDTDDAASTRSEPRDEPTREVAVGDVVTVTTDDGGTARGTLIEDFGTQDDSGSTRLAPDVRVRPRRWAIQLDDGGLVFADDDALAPGSRI
ncbi:hypothetical protein [Williamsia sterculiae]|uniref:Uncharacterized protein n=1 Tax=Williamsia sterculiae TaxID=1344003 RepID=A0A1N7CP50_9NOCA|nr:hypothetical protein [Williamsia sterculiae]SIR65257.1 hypothetical protein SAMN05445060_0259 [Williamsia sterculiae]